MSVTACKPHGFVFLAVIAAHVALGGQGRFESFGTPTANVSLRGQLPSFVAGTLGMKLLLREGVCKKASVTLRPLGVGQAQNCLECYLELTDCDVGQKKCAAEMPAFPDFAGY